LRVLVLGGTVFLGRHVVEALLARGHEVTLFHRGKRGRELFPEAERVLGDRATDLDRLPAGATWEAVVDTSAYVPAVAATSAAALRDRATRYVFVSSISVYELSQAPLNESSPTLELPAHASRDAMVPETYGPLKLLCEREVAAAFGENRTLIVRPGLIVGPYDPTDRFTYWPVRFARGGDILVPDDLDAQSPTIDVRDLAAFIVDAIERGDSGIVNTAGDHAPRGVRCMRLGEQRPEPDRTRRSREVARAGHRRMERPAGLGRTGKRPRRHAQRRPVTRARNGLAPPPAR